MTDLVFKVKTRKLAKLFGSAYPYEKKLSEFGKRLFFSRLIRHIAGANTTQIEIDEMNFTFNSYYFIGIRPRYGGDQVNKSNYDNAIAIESWINHSTKLSFLSHLDFFIRWLPWRKPVDTFMVNSINELELMNWLAENTKPNQYQLFTKFDGDLTLGFRHPEHAVLFKLRFCEETI